ncbi:MAG: hypothetical protein I8H74_02390 [Moraxellaceae bacterium]|nr:hypothetical protein [Moraxellaceae bacterium]
MKDRITSVLKVTSGLTGKEIAKILKDVDKSRVNSFLFHNPEGFIQDKVTHKWYLDSKDYILEFSSNTWLDESRFEDDLVRAGCMLSSSSKKCIIRFPEKCQILLIAGARLISLINQAVYDGREVELDFKSCPNTLSYLDRLGFFDHLDPHISVLPSKPNDSKAKKYQGNSNSLVEIASIDLINFDYQLPQKLTTAFIFHAGEKYKMAAFTIFAELIGNVQEHSETPILGFAALQLYGGNRKHIQTVISDSGVGIASTIKRNLEKHYPELYIQQTSLTSIDSEIFLISHALEHGGLSQFGSNPEENARGLGLRKTQDYAAEYDAIVTIRQHTFDLKFIYNKGKLIEIKQKKEITRINGTQVCFDFFLG